MCASSQCCVIRGTSTSCDHCTSASGGVHRDNAYRFLRGTSSRRLHVAPAPAPAEYIAPAPFTPYPTCHTAPSARLRQYQFAEYITPAPAVIMVSAFVAPAPDRLHTRQVPTVGVHRASAIRVRETIAPVSSTLHFEVEYIAPAPAVIAAPAFMVEYIATELALSYVAAAPTVYAAPAPVAEYARGGVHRARDCRVRDTSTRGRVHHASASRLLRGQQLCTLWHHQWWSTSCQRHTYPMWHQLHVRMLRQHHKWSTSRQRQPCLTWQQFCPCAVLQRQCWLDYFAPAPAVSFVPPTTAITCAAPKRTMLAAQAPAVTNAQCSLHRCQQSRMPRQRQQ